MGWPKGQPRKIIMEVIEPTENVALNEIVDGMKTLLKTFQYEMNTILEENNGILSAIKFEIKIKNLR